jgi:mannosyltransferase
VNCIFDNIIFSLQSSGGISAYWYELMSRMCVTPDLNCIFIEDIEKSKNNIFRNKLHLNKDKVIGKRTTFIDRILPIKYEFSQKFIFHSSYYRRIENSNNVRVVTTIHDFVNEKIYNSKISVSAYMRKFAIKNSDHFIAISNNTKIDLLNLYPIIPEENISVIYNGVSEDYFLINSTGIPNIDYILFVGSRAHYKNFEFVIKLVTKFDKLKLYIIGSDLSQSEIKILSMYLKPERWKLFINITNNELNILYNQAAALIYPSLYEGFGIPIIEAMKAGCPVIALNRSSVPEVAGDAALLIDKLDLSDFYDAITYLLKNKNILLKKGLENSSRFSWETTYMETLKLYNKL